MSAPVTEAHIAKAQASGYTTEKGVQMAAQFVANNEAAKAERDQLRTELDAQCLLNAKGSEREAVLLRRVDRMAKECLNLRADLDAIKAIRDEETARAERAEAELANIRALANRRNKRDHSKDTTHQLVAALDQALDIAQAELAAERARLDWLESKCPILWSLADHATGPYWLLTDFPGYTEETASQHKTARAAIDAAMKEETK